MSSNKFLILSVGLMLIISIIYIVVITEGLIEDELEEILEDPHELKDPHELEEPHTLAEIILFSIAAILYILVAIWMSRTKRLLPIIITIVGTLGLLTLYGIAISDLSELVLGMHQESIGSEGVIAKIFQIALVIVLFVRLKLK